jgi:hypothetical protein
MPLNTKQERPMRRLLLIGFAGWAASLSAIAQTVGSGDLATAPGRLDPAFGTASPSYQRQSFAEFFTNDPVGSPYQDAALGHWGRYATGAGFLVGPHPRLPGGALLTYLELDACDDDTLGSVMLQLYACDYLGVCGADPIAELQTPTDGSPGCTYLSADLTSLGYVIDNYYGELVPLVTTSRSDGTTKLLGVVYGYTLQVSPAPAAATFNDVPTGHPFFQFVEALASSGITAGCSASPPLFCPDAPLTRGQMAVFLAKALGLHWENY